jgi:hypothetical protein
VKAKPERESMATMFDRQTVVELRFIVGRLGWPRVLDALCDVARERNRRVAGALLAVRNWLYGRGR